MKIKALKLAFAEKRRIRGITQPRNKCFRMGKKHTGQTFWVRASPTTIQQRAKLVKLDEKADTVTVLWEDANYESILPLDNKLFEDIPEGRLRRRSASI
jgi:hypothetical protein